MGMSLEITEEIIARQPPEAQAIIRLLLAEIARMGDADRGIGCGPKTPQNSSRFFEYGASPCQARVAQT